MHEATHLHQWPNYEAFKQICKAHGFKVTPQRMIIYEELLKSQEHPSTDMLYQRINRAFPTISFDTVHRTLLTFSEIGVANIIEGTGNPKRFDANLDKHHHFQCLRCQQIFDIYNEAYNHLPIPADIQDRFQVLSQTVRLEGICPACRGKQETERRNNETD
jgi:Fur family transcriptional regulator, peroxide stress response regulator